MNNGMLTEWDDADSNWGLNDKVSKFFVEQKITYKICFSFFYGVYNFWRVVFWVRILVLLI